MVAVPSVNAVSAPTQAGGARIDVRNVSHRFTFQGAALPVLQDVDFAVEPGEFEGPDPSRVVVFQDPTLFPWRTVRANVGLGPQAQRRKRHWWARPQSDSASERVDAALQLVGLSEFADAFPHQLSGGMAQRVALARALVNDPALLVLDEPFGKLDSLTRIRMQGELVRLWQDAKFSVLLVTHDVEEALFLANRVIVFSERPARIIAAVHNDAPYPRHRDDPKLVALRREVLAQLGLEA
jgi:NitT/TauT family transport system ATP-binding protein